MRVLIHYPSPGAVPAGVWWLPKHRSQPKSYYIDQDHYLTGSVAVLGDDYDGEPLSSAQWENVIQQVTETAHPYRTFAVETTEKDPRLLLVPQT